MHKILFSLFLIITTYNCAFATKPCFPPTQEWFIDNVVKKSDLIVYGIIEDYSKQINYDRGWTKIDVIDVLKGTYTDKELTISNWQAVYEPLYANHKGSYVVLWAKNQNLKYTLTNIDWDTCVASVWEASINKTATSKIDNIPRSLNEIKKLIAEEAK